MSKAELTRFLRPAREPWREYVPWGPNDFPSPRGNPAALDKLSRECGIEFVTDGDDDDN